MATYLKRIAKFENGVNVYVQVLDSRPRAWFVYRNKKPVQQFLAKSAAETHALALARGDIPAAITFTWKQALAAAAAIEMGVYAGPLHIGALVALEYLSQERNEVCATTLRHTHLIGSIFEQSPPIPEAKAAEAWVTDNLPLLFKGTFKSKRSARLRSQTFFRCLGHVTEHACVGKHSAAVSRIQSKISATTNAACLSLTSIRHFPPFSLAEVRRMLGDCETFAAACLTLCYLSGGFRPEEGERLRSQNLLNGRVRLVRVVTKVERKGSPLASLVVQASLSLLRDFQDVRLPGETQRKRFRTTAAVMLLFSGVDVLTIKERLNHTTIAMVVNNYATQEPPDWCGDISRYLGFVGLQLGGVKINENLWDVWLLDCMLDAAERFGEFANVKAQVLSLVSGVSEVELRER